MTPCAELLQAWLDRRLPDESRAWLQATAQALRRSPTDRELFLAISLVPRRIGKDDLDLSPADLSAAHEARAGWNPAGWSTDQAARLLLLSSMAGTPERLAARLEQLFRTADVAELITFYRGLPLYPEPQRHLARAREGVRTNMKAVFEAVAHANPYPREQFGDDAWNQMVVKAVFIGSALHRIDGLEQRRNADLARMLHDYAHERWAAHRDVSPELWRCVGPFADSSILDDLERLLLTGSEVERRSAALALVEAPGERARGLLQSHPALVAAVAAGALRWPDILDRKPDNRTEASP